MNHPSNPVSSWPLGTWGWNLKFLRFSLGVASFCYVLLCVFSIVTLSTLGFCSWRHPGQPIHERASPHRTRTALIAKLVVICTENASSLFSCDHAYTPKSPPWPVSMTELFFRIFRHRLKFAVVAFFLLVSPLRPLQSTSNQFRQFHSATPNHVMSQIQRPQRTAMHFNPRQSVVCDKGFCIMFMRQAIPQK